MSRSFSIPIRNGRPATIFHWRKFRGLLLQPSHSPFYLAAEIFAQWLAEMTCPHREKNDPRNWSSSGGHSAYHVCNDLREKNRAKVAQKCGVVSSVELEATYRASTLFQRSLSCLFFFWEKNAKIAQNKTGKPLRRLDYFVWFCPTAGKNRGAGSRWAQRDPALLIILSPGDLMFYYTSWFLFCINLDRYFVTLVLVQLFVFFLHLQFLTILFLHYFFSIDKAGNLWHSDLPFASTRDPPFPETKSQHLYPGLPACSFWCHLFSNFDNWCCTNYLHTPSRMCRKLNARSVLCSGLSWWRQQELVFWFLNFFFMHKSNLKSRGDLIFPCTVYVVLIGNCFHSNLWRCVGFLVIFLGEFSRRVFSSKLSVFPSVFNCMVHLCKNNCGYNGLMAVSQIRVN